MIELNSVKPCGRLVAATLAGSWRRSPPSLEISAEEVELINPLLLSSGAGALGWWRIQNSSLVASSPAATKLERAYRFSHLQSALHVHNIKQLFILLRDAGIEPLLMKGWGVARLYAEPGLRQYSDTDLCVRPDQYAMAKDVVKSVEAKGAQVDLHRGARRLDDLSWDELYERSELVRLDDVNVRVLGPEDHLRVVSVHMLGHGAWRPLWLCDVAAALESRPADFDWKRCLSRNRRRADWVACAIGLAHQLLGAEMDDTPVSERARNLPDWLVPAVLRQWNTCINPAHRELALDSLLSNLNNPAGLLKELQQRWDYPIRATIELRGPFNKVPRMPFQLAAMLMNSPEIPKQLMKLFNRHFSMPWRSEEIVSPRA